MEFDFSQALIELKAGKAVERKAWEPRGWYLKAQLEMILDRDTTAAVEQPFLNMHHTGGFVPWAPQQFDLFATDYRIRVVV